MSGNGGHVQSLNDRLIRSDPRSALLTEGAVSDALKGFPLTPKPGMEWLARAIQGALYWSDSDPFTSGCNEPEPWPESNTEAKENIQKLAQNAEDLFAGLLKHYWEFENILGPNGRFQDAIEELEWLAAGLSEAAAAWPKARPRGRETATRKQRIHRAACLSPVFEMAFDCIPAVNNWPESDGGPWRDFYQRIVRLAFGEVKTPDWKGVLKVARWQDSRNRVTFPPGYLPDYPL